jgi:DDE superfamily endonuclease/Helix-turn-helix of DDE superfamily endonuclease
MLNMIFRYKHIHHHPVIFQKLTGLTVAEFDDLYEDVEPRFEQAEYERLNQRDRQRAMGGGQKAELEWRDQILLTVTWLRQYPEQGLLGYLFGVSQPTVGRYIGRVLPVLEAAGQDTMRLPEPGRKQRRSWDKLLLEIPELMVVVDSFEQRVERPKAKNERDGWYSGKKRSHTIKSQVAVDGNTGRIVHIAESVSGRCSDIKLLDQSSLLERLPPGVGCAGDLGYQGIGKRHPLGFCPRKKPRAQPQQEADRHYNRAFAQFRIIVENSINRLRHYQSLTQTDRHHRRKHTMRVRAVAGLVNLQMIHRLAA